MKKTVTTIRDVAAAANVSIATVSKYVNGAQRFSPDVEAALDAAIAALGYRSNPLARSMITGRTDAIGLVAPDLGDTHFGGILRGAGRIAGARGVALILADTAEALLARVDGLLVMPGTPPDTSKPLVAVGMHDERWPSVAADERAGAAMLARHLCMLGHHRIAYLGVPGAPGHGERLDGLRAGLDGSGAALAEIAADSAAATEAERLCAGIVLGERRPDALVCHDDMAALAFMREAARLGLRLPRDLSVAGFGNAAGGQYATPALTTLDLQPERVGALALTLLLALVRDETVERHALVAPQLVLRGSTAARQA